MGVSLQPAGEESHVALTVIWIGHLISASLYSKCHILAQFFPRSCQPDAIIIGILGLQMGKPVNRKVMQWQEWSWDPFQTRWFHNLHLLRLCSLISSHPAK
jgi:hypothetical protein